MTVTAIATILSQEFAATVAAAEANDRAEVQSILNEFGRVHMTYLQAKQQAEDTYAKDIECFLRRLCDLRDRKIYVSQGRN